MAHQPHDRQRAEGQSPALSDGGETIAAIATPPGRGGIGVVRVSGARSREIALAVAGQVPAPRHATLVEFRLADGAIIDTGLALFFPAPNSYTGDDVLELQAHGGPVVMGMLLQRCLDLGARIAHPGEFTQRAFLNERLDLAQAESVADLIDAASEEAARGAARSLLGEFSMRVHRIVDALVALRMHVEASIDFPEEEIDPADRREQETQLAAIGIALASLLEQATQGAVLRDGLTVVLAGRPNVGKSSLLNRLAGEDLAIVTPIAGTTRDYVRATVILRGVPIHFIDTAGLRETADEVERIGVERTWRALESAGAVIFLEDCDAGSPPDAALRSRLPAEIPTLRVRNKIDLVSHRRDEPDPSRLSLSTMTGEGVDDLVEWVLGIAGWKPHSEGGFIARKRHLGAIAQAQVHICNAADVQAFEFKAEELRLAQRAMGQITGEFSSDMLLGEIFSHFCVGK